MLDFPPRLVSEVRAHLRAQHAGRDGYTAQEGGIEGAWDLEIRLRGDPVHYFVIYDGDWAVFCARKDRCLEVAASLGATVWLAVPAAFVEEARRLAAPDIVGPRLVGVREEEGVVFFEWW